MGLWLVLGLPLPAQNDHDCCDFRQELHGTIVLLRSVLYFVKLKVIPLHTCFKPERTMSQTTTQTLDDLPELDALLHDFFQQEMPSPWPESPLAAEEDHLAVPGRLTTYCANLEATPSSVAPTVENTIPLRTPAKSSWRRVQKYLSLALTLAILVTGSWILLGTFPGTPLAPDTPQAKKKPDTTNNNALEFATDPGKLLPQILDEPKKATTPIPTGKNVGPEQGFDLDQRLKKGFDGPGVNLPDPKKP